MDWVQGLVHVLELTDGTSVDSCLLVLDQVPEVGHLLLLHLGVDDELLLVFVLLDLPLLLLLHGLHGLDHLVLLLNLGYVDCLALNLVVGGVVGVALAALPGRLTFLLSINKGLLLSLYLGCSLAVQNHLVVVYRLLGCQNLELILFIRRLRRQSKLLVQFLPELFEFGKSLAEVVIFKVAACVGILVLPVGILIYVDSFEICEVNIVDIAVVVLVNVSALHLARGGGGWTHLLGLIVGSPLLVNRLGSFHIGKDFSKS